MKYLVSWPEIAGLEGKEVEVEGEARWDAVVEAATQLGLETVAPMQQLFDSASVVSLGRKRIKICRFEDQKVLLRTLGDLQKSKLKKKG